MGRRNIFSDACGFSTTFDILLFLVMISIAAIILLPEILGNTQVESALESKSQKQSSQTLFTLLNGRVDEFGYIVAGDQMDAIAIPLNISNSSVYETGKKIIAGKEVRHKTFADIAAENAATQWVIYHNGTTIKLNFLMTNYTNSLDNVMKDHLERQIGDRYSYNLTVVWRPFVSVPVGGDVSIGEPAPENAYTESTYITMPYRVEFTRKRVEAIIDSNFNKSKFGNLSSSFDALKKNATNRTAIEEEISNKIFDSINGTIDDAVDRIVDETLGPVIEDAKSTMIEQVNNLLPESDLKLNMEINDMINDTLDSVVSEMEGSASDKLKSYLKDAAKEEVREIAGEEIKELVTELADLYVNNAMTTGEIRDRILTEVFSRINISRAQVTLSIWEKRR